MFDEIAIRDDKLKLLNECIDAKKKVGRKLADAEYHYKKARTMLMHRMMLDGYELHGEKTKPIAATAVYNLAQGDPTVAAFKKERDICQADYDVLQEKIYALKKEIDILTSDIESSRKGM